MSTSATEKFVRSFTVPMMVDETHSQISQFGLIFPPSGHILAQSEKKSIPSEDIGIMACFD